MRRLTGTWAGVAMLAVAVLSGCDREATSTQVSPTDPELDVTFFGNTTRTFTQLERLGNPLVSEALIEKREHGTHNSFGPDRDRGHFTDDIQAFVNGPNSVAKREAFVGNTLVFTLLPDMLMVFPNRAAGVTAATVADAANVGWLTHALAPNNTGYGGRKLQNDDVVDKALGAVFGNALAPVLGPVVNNNNSPGLVTDNVGSNDKVALTFFPYVPAGTPNP